MHTTTHVRSWPLLALGGVFAVGTTYVVLDDVRQGAAFTTDHVMTVLVIIGTLAAGHCFWPAVRETRLMSALGLALVFLGGTYFCVSGSAGRSAKVSVHAEAEANKVTDAYTATAADLKDARLERTKRSGEFAKQCATGEGVRCKGLKKALEDTDDQIRLLQVRLDGLKPAEPANAERRYNAELLSLFVKAPVDQIEKAIGLVTPIAKALVLELATIVFLSLALGHKVVPRTAPPSTGQKQLPPPREVPVEDPVIAALRERGSLTNQELADVLGVQKGTASKAVSARADLLHRERDGRHVRISLREQRLN